MKSEKISLIIPVFNTVRELPGCLESALSQTYTNMEIICVDDGSTDGSGEVLDDFYERYPGRMVVIHQKNGGESHARNVGLDAATGSLIGFMDCDDWIDTDMYQILADTIYDERVDMVCASWYKEYPYHSIAMKNSKPVKNGKLTQTEVMHYVYRRDEYQSFAFMWDKLYRRKLLMNSDGNLYKFDESLKLGGDVLYLAEILLNVKSAVYVDRNFYHYRQRAESGMHQENIEKRMDWLMSYQKVIRLFDNHCVDDETKLYVKRFLAYHSCNAAEIAAKQNDEQHLKKCQMIMRQYQNEYEVTNQEYPERISHYTDILNLKL